MKTKDMNRWLVWDKGKNKKNFTKYKLFMLVDLNNNIKCIFIYNLTELKTVIGESQLTFL